MNAGTGVLSERRLNRATSARQLLLEAADLGVVDAIGRIAGLQAQEPASPYIGLWARLAFADRTRIVSDADRARIIARNDTLPAFLVDGVVAGRWWAVTARGRTRIELEPFGRLAAKDRQALEAIGDRLARFVEPYEPRVYARYQRWRTDGR